MSRKYMNGKWCVRCGRKGMTPFLRDSVPKIQVIHRMQGLPNQDVTVVDIGCGNGRSMTGLQELSYVKLFGYDMCGDSENARSMLLGKDKFPHEAGSVDLVLANYVFMFLDPAETAQVVKEINRITHTGSVLVLELYPAKDSCITDNEQMVALQHALHRDLERDLPLGILWERVRWCKGKCLLHRVKLPEG